MKLIEDQKQMAVYVDPLFATPLLKRWPYPRACHLFADTLEELHEIAMKIGLKKSWFQNKIKGLPHYDLTESKREKAIEAGAVALTQSQAARKMRTMYRKRKELI